MKFSKRILSIFLALFIFISVNLIPVSAVTTVLADTDTTYTSGDYQYKILEDGTAELIAYFGTDEYLVIPGYIDNNKVSTLGSELFEAKPIKKAVISENIIIIKEKTFYLCNQLESITIPNSVKVIGKYSFCNCSELTKIVISDEVEYIDEQAFLYCTKLQSVIIGERVSLIKDSAFFNCKSLKKVVIPATVTTLSSLSFGYYSFEAHLSKYNDFKIYGYPNTAGETYAIENEFEFIPLDTGDADESTAVDINDVTCMQKIIAKINSTNDYKTANCDLNGDGKLNIRDATLLQLYLANKIDKFPVQE